MRKLAAVEEARAIMREGMEWSMWRWLLERQRVREIADRATAALNRADNKVKRGWPEDLKIAYEELSEQRNSARNRRNGNGTDAITPDIRILAKRIKEADDKAERCRLEAENTFDEAERRFSTDLAREGARKALKTYELREAAIRKAEAAGEQVAASGKATERTAEK